MTNQQPHSHVDIGSSQSTTGSDVTERDTLRVTAGGDVVMGDKLMAGAYGHGFHTAHLAELAQPDEF